MQELDLLNKLDEEPNLSNREGRPVTDVHMDDLLRLGVEMGGSDIHLTVGLPPMVRCDGMELETAAVAV